MSFASTRWKGLIGCCSHGDRAATSSSLMRWALARPSRLLSSPTLLLFHAVCIYSPYHVAFVAGQLLVCCPSRRIPRPISGHCTTVHLEQLGERVPAMGSAISCCFVTVSFRQMCLPCSHAPFRCRTWETLSHEASFENTTSICTPKIPIGRSMLHVERMSLYFVFMSFIPRT